MKKCTRCQGRKKLICPKCGGTMEHPKGELCWNCSGGMIDCPKCNGTGEQK